MERVMIDLKTFSSHIEKIVSESDISYINAIVHYCTKHNIEIEAVSKLITPKIKSMIYEEANRLNLLKEKSNNLPV